MSESEAGSSTRERGLSALLDTLVPASPDRNLPGAGEIGLASVLLEEVPDLIALIDQGLGELDTRAADRGETDFASLPADARSKLLSAFAAEGAPLVPALVFHTYTRYYQDRRVVEALGLEHRPPYPDGFPMEPTDTALFENVRRRGRLYR